MGDCATALDRLGSKRPQMALKEYNKCLLPCASVYGNERALRDLCASRHSGLIIRKSGGRASKAATTHHFKVQSLYNESAGCWYSVQKTRFVSPLCSADGRELISSTRRRRPLCAVKMRALALTKERERCYADRRIGCFKVTRWEDGCY